MRDTFVSPFDPAVRDLRLLHYASGGAGAGQQPGGARAFGVIFFNGYMPQAVVAAGL